MDYFDIEAYYIHMTKSNHEIMTTEPVRKLVCKLAVPSIIIMLVMAMYNVADTYFVSTLGTSATAAVGITFSFMNIIQAIGFYFGQGAGNYISRALGAKEQEHAEKMAATGFFTSFGIGIIIAILGLIFLEPIALILGSTDTILPYSIPYLRYVIIACPFMITSFMLNTTLRFQGRAIESMVGMVSGAVLNVILDPIFIWGLDMGINGAGLATLIGQFTGFAILLFCCSRGESIRIRFRNFSPSFFYYKEMFRGGFPSLVRQSIASVASILLNVVAGGFGDAAIAAIAISNRIAMMAHSATIGFGQGFQPVCGFNYGAQQYDRVKKAFGFTVIVTISYLICASIVIFIFAPEIISLFRPDDLEVLAIGTLALRAQAITLPLQSLTMTSNMMMQTMGKVVPAIILALSRQGLFLIPILFILANSIGLLGIQICTPLADICSFLLAIPFVRSVLKGLADKTKN